MNNTRRTFERIYLAHPVVHQAIHAHPELKLTSQSIPCDASPWITLMAYRRMFPIESTNLDHLISPQRAVAFIRPGSGGIGRSLSEIRKTMAYPALTFGGRQTYDIRIILR